MRVGVLENAIIGHLFIDDNLTGDMCLIVLADTFNPFITVERKSQMDVEGHLVQPTELLHLKQDDDSPHFYLD